MPKVITPDDFIETYAKLRQRGLGFISSKFNLNEIDRAKTAFNHLSIQSSNWWIIPKVQQRWRKMISGNKDLELEQFIMENHLKGLKNLKMLSLGSGDCTSELKFAKYKNFKEILCTDIAEKPLNKAKEIATKENLNNIKFQIQDVNNFSLPENQFDVVYFRASLHHFRNIDSFIGNHILKTLKSDGFLIIDEYVGPTRLQFSKHQIKSINKSIKLIPKKLRKRFKLNFYKNKVYGAGLIRMVLADPSECVDSASIMPSIRKYFETVHETGYGGNILTLALKDIAHHFVELDDEKEATLNSLFDYEDHYLQKHKSDYIFGIYKPKTNIIAS
ncbi:class I SAM-dependent methyltransferase [Flavobacteriaceae bacterium SZ-1-7]|uniref:class I SAM-dependent methyltransferase n=1 Tax=Tamlana sedimenti TaxID=3134126 RepID=UPI00312855F7